MSIFLRALVIAIIAKAVHFVCLIIYLASPNSEVLPSQPGPCQYLKGLVEGSEDIAAVGDGRYIIASGHKDSQHPALYGNRTSRMYVFNMNNPFDSEPQPLRFSGDFNVSEFITHGISLKYHEAGGFELLSVNHFGWYDSVERFSVNLQTNTLTHIGSTKWDGFGTLNDVQWAEDGFYFSCYIWSSRSNPFIKIELFVAELGFIGYCDFRLGCRRLHSGLSAPDGLALSQDKKFLYVAQSTRKDILVYRRTNNNELTLIQRFECGHYLDNVHLSNDGRSLGAGAYTNMIQLIQHLRQPQTPMYSIAVHYAVDPVSGLLSGGVQLFSDSGRSISACCSAQLHDSYLLLGSVSHKSMVCRVDVGRDPAGINIKLDEI